MFVFFFYFILVDFKGMFYFLIFLNIDIVKFGLIFNILRNYS